MMVCKVCGNNDIHIMSWTGVNDGVWKGDINIKDNKWCTQCEAHTAVKRVSYKYEYDPKKDKNLEINKK